MCSDRGRVTLLMPPEACKFLRGAQQAAALISAFVAGKLPLLSGAVSNLLDPA
jgi:hypothetical protein